MTKDRLPDKGAEGWAFRKRGDRQIGALVPGLTRPAFKRKSPLLVRLMLDWEDFVGPRLGRETEPRRIAAGTLTLACSGPIAMELQHFAPQIVERINTACGLRGEAEIRRLRIVQDRTVFESPRKSRPRPLEVAIPDIDDDALREALERLGGQVGARRRR